MKPQEGQSIRQWIESVSGTWKCKVCGRLFGILDPGNPNGNYAFAILETHFKRSHKPDDFFEKVEEEPSAVEANDDLGSCEALCVPRLGHHPACPSRKEAGG